MTDPWWFPLTGGVLLGGSSSRFGSHKALAVFGQTTVGGRVVRALRDAEIDPVVAIGGEIGHHLGVPTVPDIRPGEGPLAGLVTALQWARTGAVLVTACDMPLLTGVHALTLIEAAKGSDRALPVIATDGGQAQLTFGIWPATMVRELARKLQDGSRSLNAALDGEEWIAVDIAPDEPPDRPSPLTDVDTPEALSKLMRLADPDPNVG